MERNVRGQLFDSEGRGGGGGGCQMLFGEIIYFRHGLGREIYFHVALARENLFSQARIQESSSVCVCGGGVQLSENF